MINHHRVENIHPLLNALTDFLIEVHEQGVLHHDLNPSNILYKQVADNKYDFQLVDINRMEFRDHLSNRERLDNMSKFGCDPEAFFYILGRYADLRWIDHDDFQLRGIGMRLMDDKMHDIKVTMRRKIHH